MKITLIFKTILSAVFSRKENESENIKREFNPEIHAKDTNCNISHAKGSKFFQFFFIYRRVLCHRFVIKTEKCCVLYKLQKEYL